MFLKVVQAISLALLLAVIQAGAVKAAPISLMAAQSCSAAGMDLTVAWTNGSSAVLQQFVNVSHDNNGWIPGTFSLTGPFAADVNSAKVTGLNLGIPYFVRVSQLLANGNWDSSETLTVTPTSATTSTCAPSPSAAPVTAPVPVVPPPFVPAATDPSPTSPAISSSTTSVSTQSALNPLDSPSELLGWLQSIGVLGQPTVQSFVRDAVAAFQQAPMPGQLPQLP